MGSQSGLLNVSELLYLWYGPQKTAETSLKLTAVQTDQVSTLQEEPLVASADTVLLVANAFEDIRKDSPAHRAVGCTKTCW